MSLLNRALIKRAALAASTALIDAEAIEDPMVRRIAIDAAIRADDAANVAIWAVGDADPLFLEQVVAEALGHADRVIQLAMRDFAMPAAC